MFKKIVVAMISFSLAYAPIAMAQSGSPLPVGWTKLVGEFGHDAWIGPGKLSPGGSVSGGQAIWNAATKGAVTVSTTGKLALATGEAAIVVKGVATGAGIFMAAKTVLGVATGTGLILNTAIVMTPMIIDYFTTPSVKLGPLSDRGGTTPFQLARDEMETSCQATFASALTAHPNYRVRADTSGYCFVESPNSYPVGTWSGITDGWPTPTMAKKWYPASMNDIAPYMDAPEKITTPAQLEELVKQGAKVDLTYSQEVIDSYFPPGSLSKPVTGPATVLGTPTVTVTNKDGQTTKVTETPRSDVKYSTGTDAVGNTVPKVTATPGSAKVTTVTDDSTGVTTTTETTDQTKPVETDTPDLCALHPEIVACAKVDEVDMCKKYPDSLACQKTDEPDVPDLETLEKPITFSPDGGWLGSGASCPAPRHLSSGTGADFSFQPYCDFMIALKPVFMGVAYLSGAMILIGANRKE